MGIRWKDGGYSTHVKIYLILHGETIEVAQVGPRSFVLREPRRVPAGLAQLRIHIDDNIEEHDVFIGASDSTATEVEYA